jgi:hypothetical protein
MHLCFKVVNCLASKRMVLYLELGVLFSFVHYRKFQAAMQVVAMAESVV